MNQLNNNVHTKDVKEFTMEDAVELALLIERQEQSLKLMKDKLKSYVKLNGGVETSGKVWDFVPAFTWNFSVENLSGLAAMITIEGKNPYEFFKLGATEVDKLMKNGFSEDFLKQFGSRVPTNPTFKSVTKK